MTGDKPHHAFVIAGLVPAIHDGTDAARDGREEETKRPSPAMPTLL